MVNFTIMCYYAIINYMRNVCISNTYETKPILTISYGVIAVYLISILIFPEDAIYLIIITLYIFQQHGINNINIQNMAMITFAYQLQA